MNVSTSTTSFIKPFWIESNIYKLECFKYVPSTTGKCKCGRDRDKHKYINKNENITNTKWHYSTNAHRYLTDAFGILEFQGGPHPLKARYVRVHFKTSSVDLLHLLLHEWKMKVPNLVISIIGGLVNFNLQPKLKELLKNGLIKAAKTTGAWILTSGINTGVVQHVGEALKDEVHAKGSNIVVLGVAPWGMVQNRHHLIGKEKVCPYYSITSKNQTQAALNMYHNYFLLADNGTVDKFGAEIVLRRNLERYLASESIRSKYHNRTGTRSEVPVVAVLIEGGIQAFRVVFELVTDDFPVPVVVCEGSGRAADLLAFMHRNADEEGELPSEVREKLMKTIGNVFFLKKKEIDILYKEMKLCLKQRDLITIYRMDEDCPDIDVAILTVLLQCSKLSKADQLSLTVAWNRPDIAKSQLFDSDIDWLPQILESAMTDSLLNDRMEFIRLLLKNGVNIHRYLSNITLEYLYNCCATNGDVSFNSMLRNALNLKKPIQLRHVGHLIEMLAGSGYEHHFCHQVKLKHTVIKDIVEVENTVSLKDIIKFMNDSYEKTRDLLFYFRYPYTELQQWALLTRRYDMAMYMAMSGEEAIAKSLFAVRILRGLKNLIDMDNASEYFEEITEWENKFEQLAVELQDHCYKHSPEETRRLLCYELRQFSNHTCISLAYLCQSKAFLSHVCTQYILNDLWYGGLRQGKFIEVKVMLVLCGLLMIIPIFPLALLILKWNRILHFKSKQELAMQPQTLEEYLNESVSSTDRSNFTFESSTEELLDDKKKMDISSNDQKNEAISSVPAGRQILNTHNAYQYEEFYTDININCVNISTENTSKAGNIMKMIIKPRKESEKDDNSESKLITMATTTTLFHPLRFGKMRSLEYTNLNRSTPLTWKKKIHEFFNAPITKFYMNVVAYIIFLIHLIVYSIRKIQISQIKWIEYYVYIYIISNFLDHIRKVTTIQVANILLKVKIHFDTFWNSYDFCLSSLCLAGIFLRFYTLYEYHESLSIAKILSTEITKNTSDTNSETSSDIDMRRDNVYQIFLWARNILVLSSGGWIIKSLELMQNWRLFGAYIEMIRSMTQQITPPILILGVIMTAFGTIRQGLMYLGDDSLGFGEILKKIYLKPYFMLYGEVYAGEIDPVDFPKETRLAPLVWIVPMMMVLFMLSAVVVILSLVIAGITDIFGKVKESSVKVYMYLRYPMIVEYESRSFIPPPFLPILWLYNIIELFFITMANMCYYSCKREKDLTQDKKEEHSAGLKLFLSTDEIETLHDFEEESVEDYYRQSKISEALKLENLIKNSIKGNELMQYQLQLFRSTLQSLKLNHILENQKLNEIANFLDGNGKIKSLDFNKKNVNSMRYGNLDKRKLLKDWSKVYKKKYGNNQLDLYDELNVSDWKLKQEPQPLSPAASASSLDMLPVKSEQYRKSKKRKPKRIMEKDKEKKLRHAENMERFEMTSVIVKRLRQLSYIKDDLPSEEILDVVNEIETYKFSDRSDEESDSNSQ